MWRYIKLGTIYGLSFAFLAAGVFALVLIMQGAKLFSVQSGSMAPTLNKGDLVAVTSVPVSDLAVGDIVTFANPANESQTITHRITEISNDMSGAITTKGDANNFSDTPIQPRNVVGAVKHSYPYAGTIVDFVRQPIGLIVLVYLPALVILAAEFNNLVKYYKKKQPYFANRGIEKELSGG